MSLRWRREDMTREAVKAVLGGGEPIRRERRRCEHGRRLLARGELDCAGCSPWTTDVRCHDYRGDRGRIRQDGHDVVEGSP